MNGKISANTTSVTTKTSNSTVQGRIIVTYSTQHKYNGTHEILHYYR